MKNKPTFFAVDFLKDDPFCEWVYSVDIETKKRETLKSGKLVAHYIVIENGMDGWDYRE